MPQYRTDRISQEVRKEVDAIIRDALHDPRIGGTFCVTRAEVTRDLRHAKVYVSVLEQEQQEGLMVALKSAAGFVRRELGMRLNLRYTPEITFIADHNIEYGIHIAKLLKDVAPQTEGVDADDANS